MRKKRERTKMDKNQEKVEFEIWDHGTESNPSIVILRDGKGFCQTIGSDDVENAELIIKACRHHQKLVDVVEKQHKAIDSLLTLASSTSPEFMPSKSGKPWEALLAGNRLIAEIEND